MEVHPGISIKERRNTDEVMIKMIFLTAFFISLIIRSKGWFEKKAVPEFIQNTILSGFSYFDETEYNIFTLGKGGIL